MDISSKSSSRQVAGTMSDFCRLIALIFLFDIPEGLSVYVDKVSYCNHGIEDALQEADISLKPVRKKNSKRQYPPWEVYHQQLRESVLRCQRVSLNNFFGSRFVQCQHRFLS